MSALLREAVVMEFLRPFLFIFCSTAKRTASVPLYSWELLQVDMMFVGIVVIGILGLITSALFQELERLVIPWKGE
jgi:NitT/TauT family transport system permease protein